MQEPQIDMFSVFNYPWHLSRVTTMVNKSGSLSTVHWYILYFVRNRNENLLLIAYHPRSTIYSAWTQDSVQTSRLQVSDDHINTKSKSKNILRRDGKSHKMIYDT